MDKQGFTYIRVMTTLFHDIMHKEIEVYVEISSSSQRRVQIIWMIFKSSLLEGASIIWSWILQNVSLVFLLESYWVLLLAADV